MAAGLARRIASITCDCKLASLHHSMANEALVRQTPAIGGHAAWENWRTRHPSSRARVRKGAIQASLMESPHTTTSWADSAGPQSRQKRFASDPGGTSGAQLFTGMPLMSNL